MSRKTSTKFFSVVFSILGFGLDLYTLFFYWIVGSSLESAQFGQRALCLALPWSAFGFALVWLGSSPWDRVPVGSFGFLILRVFLVFASHFGSIFGSFGAAFWPWDRCLLFLGP